MLRIIRNDSIEDSAIFEENYDDELLMTQIVLMNMSAKYVWTFRMLHNLLYNLISPLTWTVNILTEN